MVNEHRINEAKYFSSPFGIIFFLRNYSKVLLKLVLASSYFCLFDRLGDSMRLQLGDSMRLQLRYLWYSSMLYQVVIASSREMLAMPIYLSS